MKSSEHINELADALSRAQGIMQIALKDSNNPFYKSSYADLTAIWQVAQAPLSANNLAVVQATRIENDKIIMENILMHKSGQWISSDYPVNFFDIQKKDAQGVGSAMTYARRYSLQALLGIVADQDDDGNAASAKKDKEIKQKDRPVITNTITIEQAQSMAQTAFTNDNDDKIIKEAAEKDLKIKRMIEFMAKAKSHLPSSWSNNEIKDHLKKKINFDSKEVYSFEETAQFEKLFMDKLVDNSKQDEIPF